MGGLAAHDGLEHFTIPMGCLFAYINGQVYGALQFPSRSGEGVLLLSWLYLNTVLLKSQASLKKGFYTLGLDGSLFSSRQGRWPSSMPPGSSPSRVTRSYR